MLRSWLYRSINHENQNISPARSQFVNDRYLSHAS
jgi:hypothetical protein